MNIVILEGRLTRDPELRANGSVQLVKYTIAVDREYKKAGEEKQTDYFNCVSFGKTSDFIDAKMFKGDLIQVQGRVEIQKWNDKDGKARESVSIVGDKVRFAPTNNKAQKEDKDPITNFEDAPEGLPFA